MNKNYAGKLFAKANFGVEGVFNRVHDLYESRSGQLVHRGRQKASLQIGLSI